MGRLIRLASGFALAAAVGIGVAAGPAGAQGLDRVESLMAEGRFEDARATLMAWADQDTRRSREDRQRGLWLRGLLTLDAAEAGVTYRQLVLEYPGGPWTDRALLRLGQAAVAEGDLREAESSFTILERDYPASPVRQEAVAWLQAHRGGTGPGQERPAPPRTDTEPMPAPPADAAALSGDFTVQAGAFSELDRALELARDLRESGFDPRVVQLPDSDLYRVRLGRFPVRDGAEALLARVRSGGFDAAVATGARRERPAG